MNSELTSAAARLCSTLDITCPIAQAPIGSASCTALTAAVSNAGGLGTLAMSWRSIDDVRASIQETRGLTDKPFAANLVLAWPQEERLDACLDAGVRLISLFWGEPAPYIERVVEAGGTAIVTVGSVSEARRAADSGAGVIVAQGFEAGGHVRGTTSTFTLLPAVVGAVAPIPVLASGAIGDGRGIAAALALGAAGVWLGTRFLATPESNIHAVYRNAIVGARADDTVYGAVFDGGWLDAPHRVIRNRTVKAWEDAGRPSRGARPLEGEVVAHAPDGTPLLRYGDDIPVPGVTGDASELALYAGQSAGVVDDIVPAEALVGRLWHETMAIVHALGAVR